MHYKIYVAFALEEDEEERTCPFVEGIITEI